jgi:hypothetical protein
MNNSSRSLHTDLSKINAVILCAVNVIFAFIGIILNSVVIISLLNSRLQVKLCYFMIFILSVFDFAVSAVFHPLILFETMSMWLMEKSFYSIKPYYIEHLFVFSLTALFTMTLERYLALVHPFFHHANVTKSRLIAIFMLLQIPFGLPYFSLLMEIKEIYLETAILALVVAVFVAIVFLNCKIFRMVRTVRKRMVTSLGNLNGPQDLREGSKLRKPHNFSLGKISTCFLAVVCLSVCYFPTIVMCIVRLAKRNYDDDDPADAIRLWEETFLTLNSTLNCLIFFYRNSTLRRRGIETIEKCFCVRGRLHCSLT